jgi:hypothetical protein
MIFILVFLCHHTIKYALTNSLLCKPSHNHLFSSISCISLTCTSLAHISTIHHLLPACLSPAISHLLSLTCYLSPAISHLLSLTCYLSHLSHLSPSYCLTQHTLTCVFSHTSHHITSHHITSHHITSHHTLYSPHNPFIPHIHTSHHIPSHHKTCD